MAKSLMKKGVIGGWAFLIGVVLAVIFGFIGMNETVALILMIIGLVVGFLNVTGDESTPFLMSGAVLVIVSSLGGNAFSSVNWLAGIFNALLAIFVPATIIVAIKNVFNLARN